MPVNLPVLEYIINSISSTSLSFSSDHMKPILKSFTCVSLLHCKMEMESHLRNKVGYFEFYNLYYPTVGLTAHL